MILKEWKALPLSMQCEEVKPYYDYLQKKKLSLAIKRLFDIILACFLLILFAIPMGILAVMIKKDSPGPVFYRQERVTTYGRTFYIHKFRTMVDKADQLGSAVTVDQDQRITRVGAKIRDYRLDEIPQLIDVLKGDMSFIGTRPEVKKYVDAYSLEMRATLLLPAGITSRASLEFKDEAALLEGSDHVDKTYIEEVLPKKMAINLESLKSFSLKNDLITMWKTAFVML